MKEDLFSALAQKKPMYYNLYTFEKTEDFISSPVKTEEEKQKAQEELTINFSI